MWEFDIESIILHYPNIPLRLADVYLSKKN